ncbi:MAG: bifunctional metallophosphatase/5'-nucleotidase [bacterium]|nr:bifunctional metallophosphatase/5'-nucleotidase [bacterium]
MMQSRLVFRRLVCLLPVLFLLYLLPGCALKQHEADSDAFTLTILHTNDTHGNWGGRSQDGRICYASLCENGTGGILRAQQAIAAVRRQNPATLLLDAGDQFQGTLFFTRHKGTMAAEVLNSLGYDAFVPGNHEFDDGCELFAGFVSKLNMPVLAANLSLGPQAGTRIFPWLVLERQGRKTGLVGLVNPDTPNLSSPCSEAVFADAEAGLCRAVAELQKQQVDIIILVTHLGLADDRRLARSIAGVDVVVGGHTHSLLSNSDAEAVGSYPIVETSPAGEPVLVVSNGYGMTNLGRLNVEFDAAGVAQTWDGGPITLNDATLQAMQAPPVDAGLAKMMTDRALPVQQMLTEPVGHIAVADEEGSPLESPTVLRCRKEECRSGNLLADAMRHYWQGKADIALVGGGTLRNPLPAGPVSTGDIIAAIPFDNTLVLLNMDGATLLAALEHGLSRYEEGKGLFLQVSGLRYSFNPKNAQGSRLAAVEIAGKDGTWQPIQANAGYQVTVNSFQARGGDGYSMLAGLEQADSEENLSDVLRSFISSYSPLPVELEGRIRIVE